PATAARPNDNRPWTKRESVTAGRTRRRMVAILHFGRGQSTFVDRQESVIQCQCQERQRRTGCAPELARNAAVRLLSRLELLDKESIPFFPGLDVALKQRLRLVVTLIINPAGPRAAGGFQIAHQVVERGLELGQILAPRQRVHQGADRDARQRLIEAAEST